MILLQGISYETVSYETVRIPGRVLHRFRGESFSRWVVCEDDIEEMYSGLVLKKYD